MHVITDSCILIIQTCFSRAIYVSYTEGTAHLITVGNICTDFPCIH